MCRGPHHPRGEAIIKHHVHYTPTRNKPEKITQDEELLHDKSHLEEHLEEVVDISNMSDQELEFYYFQVHDSDKNSKLDGLEILQAIHHTSHDFEYTRGEIVDKEEDFQYYVELIDRVLIEDDTDKDGFLSYPEYVAGRQKDIQISNTEIPLISEINTI
ncbi:hypothetical protein RN001_002370 [Aquatica leii]|uniref:Multiple coagulation factor deficiency protein 2 n=1 Tax=Aquatica leii TaxID=1421715 RepID=A0AAN7Q552_9COLE|nr:hypothetical protein RN001_002370 [Aquatica leii]